MDRFVEFVLWMLGALVIVTGLITVVSVFQNQFTLESLSVLIVVLVLYYFLSKRQNKRESAQKQTNDKL